MTPCPKPPPTPRKPRRRLPRPTTPIARRVRPAARSARRGAVERRAADLKWATAVKDRAGWKCERCGEDIFALLYLVDASLDAHHLRAKSHHGHLRHDPMNGIALCRGMGTNNCHGYAHAHPVLFRAWLLSVRPSAASLWQAA